jgi:hypothetical protein
MSKYALWTVKSAVLVDAGDGEDPPKFQNQKSLFRASDVLKLLQDHQA